MKSESDNKKLPTSNLHAGHRQRVKQKFLQGGLDSFQPHEIIEFLLFFGIPYKDTNPIAHTLIKKFGSFSAVFDAPIESLRSIPGMTENAAILLKSLPAVMGVYMSDKVESTAYLGSYGASIAYVKSLLMPATKEELYVLCLSNEHKLLSCQKLVTGNVNHIPLAIRQVQEAIFFSNASNAILAHNHPTGSPEPSMDDVRLTKHIAESLSYIEVTLLDHLIIGKSGDVFSFNKNGMIDRTKQNTVGEFLTRFAQKRKEWLSDE